MRKKGGKCVKFACNGDLSLAIGAELVYNVLVCPGWGFIVVRPLTRRREGANLKTGGVQGWHLISASRLRWRARECKQRNYNTMKNKKNDPDRLEMNKYCRFCKKHTSHKETR